MKNLIIALCLFAIMLGGIIALDEVMKCKVDEMITLCDELVSEVDNEDWDRIIPIYEDINKKWLDFRDILFLVLNHADIDNVDFAMIELNSMIEARELPHVKNYAENLKFYMDELLDTEEISWENVL